MQPTNETKSKHPLTPKIEKLVKENPVMIFMKGSPQEPHCGFSARACQVLEASGVKNPGHFNVLADDAMWDALEAYSEWPTVPQIFIKGEFIGGCDILTEMYQQGELQGLLQEAGVVSK